MKTLQICSLAAAAVLSLTGCAHKLGDFTVISTKNVDLSVIGSAHRGPKVSESDIAHIIVVIPTKFDVNLKQAIDNAIEATPGTIALVDARLYFRSFYIPYIYGQTAFIAEGTALLNQAQAARSSTPRHVVVRFDKQQNHYVATGVSAQEYAALKGKFAGTESSPVGSVQ